MRRDPESRLRTLKTAYTTAAFALLLAAVFIPVVITSDISLTKSVIIGQDIVEMLLIAVLISLSAATWRLYRKMLRRYSLKMEATARSRRHLEDRLADAFGYIGTVNVELREIESIMCRVRRYPQTRKEFQELLTEFVEKAMVIARAPWAAVRIVDRENFRTLKEAVQKRPGARSAVCSISNRALVEGKKIDGCTVIATCIENLSIKTACVFPASELAQQEQALIEAIAGEIEMLFIIFESDFVSRLEPAATVRAS